MSTFYGTIQGNRGAGTKGGSYASGFKASAQSYDGSVIVRLDYTEDKKTLLVNVGTSEHSSCCVDWYGESFDGTFEEFKALLKLHHDIKNGNAKVVHHRKKKQ